MVGTCRKCGIKGELHTTNTNMCASVDYPDGWAICCNCFYAEGMHPAANANAQVDAPRITAAARAEAQRITALGPFRRVHAAQQEAAERRKKEAKGENRRKAKQAQECKEAERKCARTWEYFNQAACQQCKERRRSWQGQDQDGVRTEPQGTAAAAAAENVPAGQFMQMLAETGARFTLNSLCRMEKARPGDRR